MTPPFRRSYADTAPAANQSEVRAQRELLGGALRDSDICENLGVGRQSRLTANYGLLVDQGDRGEFDSFNETRRARLYITPAISVLARARLAGEVPCLASAGGRDLPPSLAAVEVSHTLSNSWTNRGPGQKPPVHQARAGTARSCRLSI